MKHAPDCNCSQCKTVRQSTAPALVSNRYERKTVWVEAVQIWNTSYQNWWVDYRLIPKTKRATDNMKVHVIGERPFQSMPIEDWNKQCSKPKQEWNK